MYGITQRVITDYSTVAWSQATSMHHAPVQQKGQISVYTLRSKQLPIISEHEHRSIQFCPTIQRGDCVGAWAASQAENWKDNVYRWDSLLTHTHTRQISLQFLRKGSQRDLNCYSVKFYF